MQKFLYILNLLFGLHRYPVMLQIVKGFIKKEVRITMSLRTQQTTGKQSIVIIRLHTPPTTQSHMLQQLV